MSFKVEKLTITKGRTVENKEANEWQRLTYSLEMSIQSENGLEVAKGSGEALLDMWLRGELINQPQPPAKKEAKNYDVENIAWTEAQGTSGLYQRSENVDSLDHKALLKDLAAHKGKFRKNGFFYWAFQNGSYIGRKPIKK